MIVLHDKLTEMCLPDNRSIDLFVATRSNSVIITIWIILSDLFLFKNGLHTSWVVIMQLYMFENEWTKGWIPALFALILSPYEPNSRQSSIY